MKFLIILFLFVGCADKKEQETQTTTTIPQTNTTIPQIDTPIELSYDRGLELVLVDTMFTDWHTWYLDFSKEPDDNPAQGYWATYWDTNTHTFYGVTNIYEFMTTNSNFTYTINENKQFENLLHPSMEEKFTNTGSPLLYIGSTTPLERIYLDPTNQQYYIKQLMPYDTTRYLVRNSNETITVYACDVSTNKDGFLKTNYSPTSNGDGVTYTITNHSPIFPAYDITFSNVETNFNSTIDQYITNYHTPYIYFTNQEGLEFQSIQPYESVAFFLKYDQIPIIVGTNYERLTRLNTSE